MTREELDLLLHSDESYRIERMVSTTNMDKFQEAICAFANDLPGSRKKGYLLIGVHDDGRPCGLDVNDDLMKKISSIRSDGNISSSMSKEEKDLEQKSRQVFTNLSSQVKELIFNLKEQNLSKSELLGLGKFTYKSRSKLEQLYINPALKLGVVEMQYPETPRHPKQKYRLSPLGLYLLNVILKETER